MKQILIHTCCACCILGCLDKIKELNLNPILYFSNSNISPKNEFEKRLKEVKKISKKFNLKLIIEPYNHREWLNFILKKAEKNRCEKCFEYNLFKTKEKAKEIGVNEFTTTLTISRFKPSQKIFQIGESLEEEFITFLKNDFKKQAGFEKSVKLSQEFNLYRQNYCGCEFSKN